MLYSITFVVPATRETVRAQGAFESEKKARNYAAKLAEVFKEVVVWRGQPGGERVVTLSPMCDEERFGDDCTYC